LTARFAKRKIFLLTALLFQCDKEGGARQTPASPSWVFSGLRLKPLKSSNY
jgi:hypothetical protein